MVDGNPVFNTTGRLWSAMDYDLNSGSCLLVVPAGGQHKNRLSWADCEASGYSLWFLDFAIEAARVKVTIP